MVQPYTTAKYNFPSAILFPIIASNRINNSKLQTETHTKTDNTTENKYNLNKNEDTYGLSIFIIGYAFIIAIIWIIVAYKTYKKINNK